MILARLTVAVAVAMALAVIPAAATPPPPPPPGYTASWQAIDALAPFEGHWSGTEVQQTSNGDFAVRAYRSVSRLGGKDVVLMERGLYDRQDGFNRLPQAYDVICFDVKTGQYRVFLPGYRLFTGDDDSIQLAAMEHPDPTTIVWSAGLANGGKRRTTVTISEQHWREHIEEVAADGISLPLVDLDLTREGDGTSH